MKRDVLGYGVVLVFSIFFMVASADIAMTEASLTSSAFFPRILLTVLILMSALGLYKTVKDNKAARLGEGKKIHRGLAVIIGMCVGYFVLLNIVGFAIATFALLLACSLYMMGDYRPKTIAIMAAVSFALAYAIYYIFTKILMFMLP